MDFTRWISMLWVFMNALRRPACRAEGGSVPQAGRCVRRLATKMQELCRRSTLSLHKAALPSTVHFIPAQATVPWSHHRDPNPFARSSTPPTPAAGRAAVDGRRVWRQRFVVQRDGTRRADAELGDGR